MSRCGFNLPSMCCLCQCASQSIDHVFVDCKFSREGWLAVYSLFGVNLPNINSIKEIIESAAQHRSGTQVHSLWRIAHSTMVWMV